MSSGPKNITEEELAGIVDTRFAALVLYARSWNLDASEDLVQESFLKLVGHSAKKGRPENPIAWLFATIRNEAITRHRKHKRQQKYEKEIAKQRLDWFLPTPEQAILSREATEALQELDAMKREIIVLRIWSRFSFEEIAKLIATPKTTVFRQYTEALTELRKKLDP